MRARAVSAFVALLAIVVGGCQLPPPPLGSAPSLDPVLAQAPDSTVDAERWEFPKVCFNQWAGDEAVPVTRTGGAGRKVAVIGDSLTTQAREVLIARGGYDWQVTSYCGARVTDYLPGGLLHDTIGELRDFAPDAIVIALGANDAFEAASLVDSAPELLAELPAGVPVTWVLPAFSHDERDYAIAVVRADITNLVDVEVVDWSTLADEAGTRLVDNTHLTWTGTGLYASVLAGGTRMLPSA